LRECDHVALDSPFDFRSHALLYVPMLPVPSHPDFRAAADDEIVRLIEAAGGRTLVLFTSYGAMRASAAAVEARVDVPVLVQGAGSKAALLERFLTDEATCLFATMSFWQGIDPAGRTCSVVVIDKIPFPRPDDPVVAAQRDAAGTEAFAAVDLPRAGTLLAQGAGRLIRSRDDRGVVAVLDARLAEKSYRRRLLDRLPPMRRTRTFSHVEDFLNEVALD
jgi:ATP-dependent DNA helicase DinG